VFLPSVTVLLGYAAELEAERDHVLHLRGDADPERELAEAQRRGDTSGGPGGPDGPGDAAFTALAASAHFDRVLYDGGEFGASAEEEEFLGLPGLLEPEQVALLLRNRRADQLKRRTVPAQPGSPGAPARSGSSAPAAAPARSGSSAPAAAPARSGSSARTAAPAGPASGSAAAPAAVSPGTPETHASLHAPAVDETRAPLRTPTTRETHAALRKELNGLITAWHHRTGQSHGVIHAELRRACGGPPVPEATAGQIRARITMLQRWAAGR
jgi:hypothetical protein